ncbi:hypothetical protein cypCar_00044517 [Cyprinus carpio]|nr:hypothetical protein cypCar_00044517 [Cyprinus carpio]
MQQRSDEDQAMTEHGECNVQQNFDGVSDFHHLLQSGRCASPEQTSDRRLGSPVFIREKRLMMRGLSVLQLLLVTLSAGEAREIGGGNFLEDEQQWLSTVHRYSRTVKHWNRFRDDDYIRTLGGPRASDESE